MKRLLLGIAVLGLLAPADASAADHGRRQDQRAGSKPLNLPHVQRRKVWRQGEQVPLFYIVPHFFIADPRAYMLALPASGHRWINLDGDAYLVEVANGTVEDLVVVGPTDEDTQSPGALIAAEGESPVALSALRSAQR